MLLILAFLLAAHTAPPAPPISQTELVNRTQQMMDAVGTGDKHPWEKYLANDAMVFDEKGNAMDKAAAVKNIEPLPKGYTGEIHVKNAKAVFAPSVAILSYDMDETETVFGQELHARYHQTDTWLMRKGEWQIAASETMRYYEDPAAGAMPAHAEDYTGTYELAPGLSINVTTAGGKLFAQRSGGKPSELFPETCDLFFRKGVEGRRLFHRDSSGKVDALIDRRNNEDVVWKKVKDAK